MRIGRFLLHWLPPLLLAAVALGAWRAAGQADFDPISTAPAIYEREVRTPMLSARRLPATLRAPVSDELIRADVNSVITNSPSNQTCSVVRNGDRLLGNPTDVAGGLIPASNQKILTTWAALELLGPDFQFVTETAADLPPVDGVLEGNLYLVGDGDPFLYTDDWLTQYEDGQERAHTRLEDLADSVVAAGVTVINGSVVGDEALYDDVRFGPWRADLIDPQRQSGPMSALSVNEGFDDWPDEFPGFFRTRSDSADPPLQATSRFNQLLLERGVAVTGAPAIGPAPASAVRIASVESPRLVDVVTHINSFSSNFGAELLLKRLGLFASGQPTTEAGAAVVSMFLDQRGIPTKDVIIRDGSGLSEDNRLTCVALVSILVEEGPDSLLGQSLAIAAERGSLKERFVDSPASGRVRAKTGTLRFVTALSGYVLADPGTTGQDGHVTFAMIINDDDDLDADEITNLQQPFLNALTRYPEGPAIESISPEPAVAAG